MASVKDFVPTPEELKGQKLGGEKMAETAFSKTPQPAAPKQTGGVTAKVSSFTPTAEELAAQQYDTVGAKGRQPGMQTLAAKERIAASGGAVRPSAVAEVSAPELKASMQRGVEPMTKLQFATDTPASKLQIPAVQGAPKTAGIFGAKPTTTVGGTINATPAQKAIESATGVGRSTGVQPMSMDEARMAKSVDDMIFSRNLDADIARNELKMTRPGSVPTFVNDTTIPKYASEAARTNAMGTATGLAGSIIQSPAIAAQTNEALRRRGLKGIIPQQGGEEMLTTQFGRWLGGKAYDVMNPAAEQKPSPEAAPATPTAGQPLTTPATFIAGGAVDQAAPVAQKAQPKQFETSRVPEVQTAVSTEPKAPSFTREQVEGMAEKGQAVSRGAGGNFRYVQGPNGQVVKQNTDSGEVVPMSVQGITGNVLKPGEESPLAREARTRKETAFRDALMRQAFQPIDANTNVADVGTIKRNRLAAQQLLEQLDRSQQAGAQLGLEEKKLASTERATEATQEQNRLAKEADQRYKQERLGLEERKTKAAEDAAKNKPRTVIYKGEKLQGTPEDIEIGKQQLDAKIAGQWDKKNPKPSGLLATNDDVIKHYEKRAKELGYDPDITSAANLAQRIQGTLKSMSPEDRDEVNRQFQSKYGVPYSEFIVSE